MTVKIYTYKIVQHPDNVQITQTYFTSKNPGIYEPYDYASVDSFLQKSWRRAYVKGSLIESTDMQAPTQPYDLFILQSTISSVTLSWSPASDNVAIGSYKIYQDSALIATVTANTRGYLVEGLLSSSTHTFYVTAMDTSGNEGPPSNSVSITMPISDFIPPSAPGTLLVGTVTTTSIQLSWTAATDNVKVAEYNLYSNGVFFASTSQLTITIGGLTPDTTYSAYVRAVDTSGNIGPATNTVTPATLPLPDTVAPTIPILNVPVVDSSTQITLSWSASTDAVGVTGYDVYMNGSLNKSVAGNVLTTAMTGLAPSTLYSFYVTARDAAGNVSAPSNTQTATTTASADVTAPTAPVLSLTALSATTVTMQWTASFDAVGVTGYDIYKDTVFLATVSGTTLTYQATGLTPNVQYAFYVVAKDAAGNRSPNSNTLTVTTVDSNAPVIGILSTGTITDTTIVLNWTAATDNIGVTNYLVYKDSALLSTLGNVLTYTATGLTTGVVYNFYITARDAAGNVSSGSNVVSPRTVDTIAPSAPTGLAVVSTTSSSVNLSWVASTDNVAVTGYLIFRNGAQVGTSASTSFANTGLAGSTAYNYYVRAIDAAGNQSANSNTVTATTLAGRSFYVAKNGSDSNNGSIGSPWLTIQKAANTLVAGDTVYIRAGVYNERVVPANSGSAVAGYITYTTYQSEVVTLDMNRALPWQWTGILDITTKSYIIVSNLRLIDSNGFGIFVSGGTNIELLNNYTYNTEYSGIWVGDYSNIVLIDGNEIEHSNLAVNQEALSIFRSTNITVSNNKVHDIFKEGIDSKGSTNVKIFNNEVWDMNGMGIYVDSYVNTPLANEVYNNKIHDSKNPATWPGTGQPYNSSRDGIMVAAEAGNIIDGVQIYNNLIYNIAQTGILLTNFHASGAEPVLKNISIYNNTIYKCNISNTGTGGINIQGSQNSNNKAINNILSNAGAFNILTTAGTTVSNNLFNGGTASGSNPVTGDPLFVNAATGNFYLQTASPAINVGLSAGAPAFDYAYTPRPQGAGFDIGGYEYIFGGGLNSATFTNTTAMTPIVSGSNALYAPYPSPITVNGMAGTVTKVIVKFNSFVVKNYGSINAIVQAPNGALYSYLMGVSSSGTYTITWSMDQAAATNFPENTNLVINNSSYKPFNLYGGTAFPAPAPNPGAGVAYTANLAVFNGTAPNGVWNLWVFDGWAVTANSPSISGGWSITLTTA